MNAIMEKRLSDANDLREAEKFGDSIKAYTECLVDLIDTNDFVGLIHCLGGQSLIYKNLLVSHNSPVFHYLLISYAKEAYEIGEAHKDEIDGGTYAIANRVYGDALLSNGEFTEALPYFERALAVSTAEIPEKGHLKAHIGGIYYLSGDKQKGIALINEALSDIRTGNLDTYAIRVWETGCLNNLAKIYSTEGEKDKALALANESMKIATEHNLPIRQKEVKQIIDKINTGLTDFSM